MRRLRLVVFAVALAAAVLIPRARAPPASDRRFGFQAALSSARFRAGLFCPFPVYTQPVPIDRTQTVTVFFDGSGNVKKLTVTGVEYILLQNVDTGKSIVVNSSGYGVNVFNPDGSISATGGGPGLFGLSSVEGGATVHGPGLFLVDGRFSYTVTAPVNNQSFVEDLVVSGKVTSLCPVIAT
jgi:hypothetical protein